MDRDQEIKGIFENESVWSHLEELRKRLIFSISLLVVFSIGAYFFSDQILNHLLLPLTKLSQKAYFVTPYDAFVIKLQVAFWTALFLSLPLILTQVWLFVAPALYQKEKKIFLLLTFSSIILFLIGVSIAYFAVIPVTIEFFLSFSTRTLEPLISVDHYFSFVVWMALSFGLAFEAPIFLVGLVKLGVLELATLKSLRRSVIVIIFIFSAVVTPSPDPFSQCLLAIPLCILYECSLLVAGLMTKRKGPLRKVDN